MSEGYESICKVVTPSGVFEAVFGEDDVPVLYRGDEAAIQFFKNWLSINQVSGEHGVLINADRITPNELYGFCQLPGSGIIVVAPLDDMLYFAEQDEMEFEDNEGNEAMTGIATDSTVPFDEDSCEILIVLGDDDALLLDSAHWVTTKTGSHLLIEGGTIVGGAGGKLNGTKVMTKKMIKDKEDDDTFVRREYNEEHGFGARLHGGPDGKKSAENHAERLTRILGRKFTTQKEGTHVFYGFDNKRYDLHRAVPQDKAALDSATGIEKINLVKELSGIRETMKMATSGTDKLKMVKRVGEIRALLGVKKGGGGLDKNGLNADGMWPMTRAEYKKIHKDYKGTFPDGTPTALKLVNGATTIVPVLITDEKTKVIATFKNEEDNIEVRVAKITSGYSVTLKDLDSGEVLPSATIYPDEETAIQKAKEIAKVDQKEKSVSSSDSFVGKATWGIVRPFMGQSQYMAILDGLKGEEAKFFADKMKELANTVSTMPKTYEQDGKGDEAIVYLHYFKGSADWYITERDMEDEQIQAFGLADLFGDGGELGYISIDELITSGVELDLHWKPKTIGEIKNKNDEPKLTIEEEFREKLESFGNLYMHLRKLKGLEDGNPDAVLRYRIDDLVSDLKGYEKSGGREYSGMQLNDEIAILQESIEKYKNHEEVNAHSNQDDAIIKAFVAELESLKSETDITAFGDKLDEIAVRIEQAGLMDELDAELNSAADALTDLMAAAEKSTTQDV